MKYRWEIDGTAANDQTWTATGSIDATAPGAFPNLPHQAIGEAFQQLTNGKAVYGQPGEGCHGPYAITRMLIEKVE